MSEIKPYINQEDWGRSLLSRLGKSLDGDGAINVWDNHPTTYFDGTALNESHKGYGGILRGVQSSFIQWTGVQWEEVFKIPISFQGEPVETFSALDTNINHTSMNPGGRFDHVFTLSSNTSGNFFLRKFNKKTGAREWESIYALDSGYQRVAISSNSGFCVAQDKIFFVTLSYPTPLDSSNPLRHIYCFSCLTGTFQWKTTLSTETTLALRVDLGSLYLFQMGALLKINPSSGVVEATLDLSATIPANHNIGEIFLVPSKVVLISSVSGTTSITTVSENATNVLFYQSLVGGAFTGVGPLNWTQDPLNRDLLYFEDKGAIAPAQNKVWRYDARDNLFSVAALFPVSTSFVGTLSNIFKEGDEYYVYCQNTASFIIYKTKFDGNAIEFVEASFPGGEGDILLGRNPQLTTKAFVATKQQSTSYGYGTSSRIERTFYFSSTNKQIVYWNDSAFSSSGDLLQLLRSSNFKDVYASSINTDAITANRVATANSLPHSSGVIENGLTSDAAINIGSWGSAFSFSSFLGSLSTDTIGYSASYAGAFCSGLGFNAAPTSGRLLTRGSHAQAQNSGVILFDVALGRLMFEVKATGASPNTLITGFPAATPGMCLTATGLGVKLFTPAYPVDVGGTLRATTLMNSGGAVTSDERIKVGILPLNGLELWEVFQELTPISYLYKPNVSFEVEDVTEDEDGNKVVTQTTQSWPMPSEIQYGWSAQKIQEQFPELVKEDPQSKILYLNREALSPLFQSAATAKIKQLEEAIAQKDTLLTQLQSAIESLTARVEALENAA